MVPTTLHTSLPMVQWPRSWLLRMWHVYKSYRSLFLTTYVSSYPISCLKAPMVRCLKWTSTTPLPPYPNCAKPRRVPIHYFATPFATLKCSREMCATQVYTLVDSLSVVTTSLTGCPFLPLRIKRRTRSYTALNTKDALLKRRGLLRWTFWGLKHSLSLKRRSKTYACH